MGDKIKLSHIGGWPKMITNVPERPHDILDEQGDETDVPDDINNSCTGWGREENVYFQLFAFVRFWELGLYPPKWVLDNLAEKFRRHLDNPDAELFTSQMKVTSRGSGAKSPLAVWDYHQDRFAHLTQIMMLLGGYDINFSEAARATVEYYELDISEKRLMAIFREQFGDPRKFMKKNIDPIMSPFLLDPENMPDQFLKDFPEHTRRRIKSLTRGKT